MLLCPFLLEETEGRHGSLSDEDMGGGSTGEQGSGAEPRSSSVPEIDIWGDRLGVDGNPVTACSLAIGAPKPRGEVQCAGLGFLIQGSVDVARRLFVKTLWLCGARTSSRPGKDTDIAGIGVGPIIGRAGGGRWGVRARKDR